mmetsp:Transcript_15683/g.47431  ORF Transcript_15683/g.47431 Transcript_15683/m.47431 type:complete len:208 (+) Transcript_15683:676-1299(+)
MRRHAREGRHATRASARKTSARSEWGANSASWIVSSGTSRSLIRHVFGSKANHHLLVRAALPHHNMRMGRHARGPPPDHQRLGCVPFFLVLHAVARAPPSSCARRRRRRVRVVLCARRRARCRPVRASSCARVAVAVVVVRASPVVCSFVRSRHLTCFSIATRELAGGEHRLHHGGHSAARYFRRLVTTCCDFWAQTTTTPPASSSA